MGRWFSAQTIPAWRPNYWGFGQLLGEKNRSAEAIPLMMDALRIDRVSNRGERDAAPGLKALEHQVRRIIVRSGLSEQAYQAAFDGAAALLGEQPENARYRDLRGMAGTGWDALTRRWPTCRGRRRRRGGRHRTRPTTSGRPGHGRAALREFRAACETLAGLRAGVTQSSNPPGKEH